MPIINTSQFGRVSIYIEGEKVASCECENLIFHEEIEKGFKVPNKTLERLIEFAKNPSKGIDA